MPAQKKVLPSINRSLSSNPLYYRTEDYVHTIYNTQVSQYLM